MKNSFLLIIVIWIGIGCIVYPQVVLSGESPPKKASIQQPETLAKVHPVEFIALKIPFFSSHFAETPVALVNDTPITVNDLVRAMGSMPVGLDTANFQNVLQRLINIRLIILEARNIGLDETSTVQTEIEEFRLKTLLQELIDGHLAGFAPTPADVQEVYEQISRGVQLYSLTFDTGYAAQTFLQEVKDTGFAQLAERYIAEGNAQGELAEQYVKIKDLLPQIGQQVHSMKTGDVSKMFRTDDGFLLFQLVDSQFVEDEAVKKEAVRIVSDTLRRQKAMEYTQELEKKYVSFDIELYEQLDFDQNFDQYKKDGRIIATVEAEDPLTITVAALAREVDIGFFHGSDQAQQSNMLNKRKDIVISNMLFKITGELEAERLGLDRTEEFARKMTEFERSVLFREFMQKAVRPDVKISAEEVRAYYDEHIDEYSSPAMLRMNSLVFHKKQDAENALEKLRKGADFKWVSANVSGLVPPDAEGVLPFDEKLLSLTALPDDLQASMNGVKKGDTLLYAEPDGNYNYVLYMEEIFPPEPQPYEQARDAAAKAVFDQKVQKSVDEWISKLKEFYEIEIFLTDLDQ